MPRRRSISMAGMHENGLNCEAGVENPIRRAHERLGQINGVHHDRDERQVVLVANEVLDERRLVATRQTVASHPAFLQVRRRHLEHVSLPFARRKPLPAVLGIRRWLRAAVHVDRAVRQHPHEGDVPRDHVLRDRVDGTADAQGRRTARPVIGRVRLALPLRHRPFRRIPRVGAQACGVVDRQARVIADLGASSSFGQILVESLAPMAREIALPVRASDCAEAEQSGAHSQHARPALNHGITWQADRDAAGT